jgi:hypothetical protein
MLFSVELLILYSLFFFDNILLKDSELVVLCCLQTCDKAARSEHCALFWRTLQSTNLADQNPGWLMISWGIMQYILGVIMMMSLQCFNLGSLRTRFALQQRMSSQVPPEVNVKLFGWGQAWGKELWRFGQSWGTAIQKCWSRLLLYYKYILKPVVNRLEDAMWTVLLPAHDSVRSSSETW